jgi:alpha-glucosidase
MHDGQNLFDDLTSYSGEWQVDETLNQLYASSGDAYIVVGIDNGAQLRMAEYSPWPNPDFGDAEGEAYVDFIVNELKPMIDSQYRTLSDPSNTIMIGSSMGGLISHYAIFRYPEVIGKAAIYSPSFWFSDAVYDFTQTRIKDLTPEHQLHIVVGSLEGERVVTDVEKMATLIKSATGNGPQLETTIVPGGEHNELFWRTQLPVTMALFGDRTETNLTNDNNNKTAEAVVGETHE